MTLIPILRPDFYHTTNSSTTVNDFHKLRHRIYNTETCFIEDKWAEWSPNQSSIISSNIHKGFIATHAVDSLDWKNKDHNSPETYITNSILIQNCSDNQQFSQSFHVELNYDYLRKEHKLFKEEKTALPNINFNRKIHKLVPFIIDDDQNKEFQMSSKKKSEWVLLRDGTAHPSELKFPSWSSFNQILESEQRFSQTNVGSLDPITALPTQMNVIYQVINRTLPIKKELRLSYIV